MKHKTAAILGLTLASILVLARRPVASYFCNLADPAGGGLGNHVACGIYYGQSDGTLLTIAGYVLLAMALALVFRGKPHARNRL